MFPDKFSLVAQTMFPHVSSMRKIVFLTSASNVLTLAQILAKF